MSQSTPTNKDKTNSLDDPKWLEMNRYYQSSECSAISVNELSIEDKLLLFRVCKADMVTSRAKDKQKIVYSSATKLINALINENNKLKSSLKEKEDNLKKAEEEIMSLKSEVENSLIPSQSEGRTAKGNPIYTSYAKAVSNKKIENVVMFRKKNDGDVFSLINEVKNSLNPIKDEIEVTSIQNKGSTVVIKTRDEDQIKKIKKSLSNSIKIEAKEPYKSIPSILIKDIDKELTRDQVIEEIERSEKIDKENIRIKKFIEDSRFKTNRLLVNFKEEDTVRIVKQGFIKINWMCCPIEKRVNVIQCFNCFRYGHRNKNRDGTANCRNETKCPMCAGVHNSEDQCPAKIDKTKCKCVNCNQCHDSRSFKCEKRREINDKLLNKCIC